MHENARRMSKILINDVGKLFRQSRDCESDDKDDAKPQGEKGFIGNQTS